MKQEEPLDGCRYADKQTILTSTGRIQDVSLEDIVSMRYGAYKMFISHDALQHLGIRQYFRVFTKKVGAKKTIALQNVITLHTSSLKKFIEMCESKSITKGFVIECPI